MYRKRLETVQAIQRQQEDWSARLKSDGPSYPEMYCKSYNSQELYNKELKLQREKEEKEKLKDQFRLTGAMHKTCWHKT